MGEVTVVEGEPQIRRELRALGKLVRNSSMSWVLEEAPAVGSCKIFGEQGLLHLAWILPWRQLVMLGKVPKEGKKFLTVQSREEAVCFLANRGQGEARKRAVRTARRIAERLGARIGPSENILLVSSRHHCVVTGEVGDECDRYLVKFWIAGLPVVRRLLLVPSDVGSKTLLWALSARFANFDGWLDRSRETAEAAAVIEALRMVR